jgi:hypothetical protein
MLKAAWLVVLFLSLVAACAKRLAAEAPASERLVSSSDASPIPRVRPTDVRLAALISGAAGQSATFRRLLHIINTTDGIVYVEAGRCGAVRACLALKVTIAGPNRLLWIFVDSERGACDVMASIGHELWHAIEVLRERSIRSDGAIYSFIARGREQNPPAWVETNAAIRVGQDVRRELREACD